MTIRPATIANDLLSQIRELFAPLTSYIDTNGVTFRRIYADIETLGKVDGTQRLLLLARLHCVTGDREKIEYYLRNAEKLHANRDFLELAKITMLICLGYYSESLPLLEQCLQPARNLQNIFIDNPTPNGAFHMLESSYIHAKHLNLTKLSDTPPFDPAIVQIMDFWGDSDADFAAALDPAGEILRERKLFSRPSDVRAEPIVTTPDGSGGYVRLIFGVKVSFETALEMTCDYTEKLATSGVKIPPSMLFEFESLDQA